VILNNRARHGFPSFAAALAVLALLGGCKTEWDRMDECWLGGEFRPEVTLITERTISSFRPGQTLLTEVERTLGTLRSHVFPEPDAAGNTLCTWNDRGRGWQFTFSSDGVLKSCSRTMHSFHIVFGDTASANDFDRWYADRLAFNPVPPDYALGFKPGATTQEHVIAAWGPCSSAEALAAGGFVMRWGSNWDRWTLQFDSGGTLVAAPERYRSGLDG
jgi:hypothetical protein